jgi:hypothetical protein
MALNFDDLKEQVTNSLRSSWEQFQESSLYQHGRDKYENLSPVVQKLVVFGGAGFLALIFLSIPWGAFSTSSDSIMQFEDKRALIRDLLKVSREASEAPDIPVPPDVNSIKSQIEGSLQQAQLLPEQMKGVEIISETTTLIPANMVAGMLQVSLSALNLRQIVDLGYQIQAVSPSVKMLGMNMSANSLKPKYFDVVFKLVSLNVPQAPVITPDADEPKGGKKASPPKPRSRTKSTDSGEEG